VKNAVDDADQLNMLQIFKEGGYDMICVLPGNGTLMTPICQEIYRSGIKIMIIDRPIEGDDYTVFYGGDNAQGGRNAAKYLVPAEGQGPDRHPAQLRGHPHRRAALRRVHGSVEEELPRIKVLVVGDGEFQPGGGPQGHVQHPAGLPEDRRDLHPGRRGRGRRTHRDPQRQAQGHPVITGFGGSKTAYALMSVKDPLYGASMSYLPAMGGRAVALAKQILLGAKFEKNIIEPTVVVTATTWPSTSRRVLSPD